MGVQPTSRYSFVIKNNKKSEIRLHKDSDVMCGKDPDQSHYGIKHRSNDIMIYKTMLLHENMIPRSESVLCSFNI